MGNGTKTEITAISREGPPWLEALVGVSLQGEREGWVRVVNGVMEVRFVAGNADQNNKAREGNRR